MFKEDIALVEEITRKIVKEEIALAIKELTKAPVIENVVDITGITSTESKEVTNE